MQVVIELSEAQVEALNSFLSTQTEPVTNSLTGSVSMRPKYDGINGFILNHVGTVVAQMMQMYPPASVQADMQAIQAAQARIAELAKPSIVSGSKV